MERNKHIKAMLPDLELIDTYWCRFINGYLENLRLKINRFAYPAYEMWKQSFPNTAAVFEDGKCCSGSAFTEKYITIASYYGLQTDGETFNIYGVFCENELVYIVLGNNERFNNDRKIRNVCNIIDAGKYYTDEEGNSMITLINVKLIIR